MRAAILVRLSTYLRVRLMDAARASGRTLAEEAEYRIRASLESVE